MDSELLSVFHDEQYESTFNKFEENYWSVDHCENFAVHLSENLNGILPISPIEEKIAYFDSDLHIDHYSNDTIQHENATDQNQNCMFANNAVSGPTIEIVSVDPNAEFDEDDELDGSSDTNEHYLERCDNLSETTFRSRTDSSSIGDYESHTSDESDYECPNKEDFEIIMPQPRMCVPDNYLSMPPKPVTNDTETIYDEDTALDGEMYFVDNSAIASSIISGKAIDIDTENFDLAKFITEDDLMEEDKIGANLSILNELPNGTNYASESEEMIDIETVDESSVAKKCPNVANTDKKINANHYFGEDDVEKDPSWDPPSDKKEKINEKCSVKAPENKTVKLNPKPVKTCNRLSLKKKLEKKMHIGGKNISIANPPHQHTNQSKLSDKTNAVTTVTPKDIDSQEHRKAAEEISRNLSPEKSSKNIKSKECQLLSEGNSNSVYEMLGSNTNVQVPTSNKKKLNLEEYYKKRKGEHKIFTSNTPQLNSKNCIKNGTSPTKCMIHVSNENIQKPVLNTSTSQSLLIPNSMLKENTHPRLDPITEARNKVLRMQEIKKLAAQKRLIDITVSSKVGPVTKILPLEEIVKSNAKKSDSNQGNLNNSQNHTEYEEIIIVSVSCNTDIKIPPKLDKIAMKNSSTSLLYNISNTIEKVKSNENLKISNSSLITSIKSVVMQKTVQEIRPNNDIGMENSRIDSVPLQNNEEEHGEDKIIMHLPKNRVKRKTCCISTQTESLPEFPLLELILPKVTRINRNKDFKSRKYRRRKENYSSFSSDSESDNEYRESFLDTDRHRSQSRSTHSGSRHISPSEGYNYSDSKSQLHTNSAEKDHDRSRRKLRVKYKRTRNCSGSDTTASSYRSRSSSYSSRSGSRSNERREHRHRSNYYKDYKRPRNKNNHTEKAPAVEERRIVYVGRIEAETTKEDLKRKFIVYGPIKQITLHYKDTGMKYGFVTFDKSEDAFKAIDNGTTDTKINMYDISFGGRRAFCRQSYADLDNTATNTFQSYSYNSMPSSRNSVLSNNVEEDSFEALLNKMKQKLCASKSNAQKT